MNMMKMMKQAADMQKNMARVQEALAAQELEFPAQADRLRQQRGQQNEAGDPQRFRPRQGPKWTIHGDHRRKLTTRRVRVGSSGPHTAAGRTMDHRSGGMWARIQFSASILNAGYGLRGTARSGVRSSSAARWSSRP